MRNRYVDFTNNEWKNNFLIGKKIVSRPYKKFALVVAGAIFISGVIPILVWNFGTSGLGAIKFLRRFG